MTPLLVWRMAAFVAVGVALGFVQLRSLRALVQRYLGARSHLVTIAFHAARLALIVSAWVVVARLGGGSGLLAAFAGFLVARPLFMAGKGAAS